MAEQNPAFIPDQPAFIPDQGAPAFIPDKPDKEGLARKVASTIWSRAWEPVKMQEVEKIPGIEPGRAEELRTTFTPKGIPESPETSWFDKEMLARAATKSLTDFYSPGVLAMRFLSPVKQAVAGAAFTGKQAYDLYENWDKMNWAERGAALAGIVGGGAMTGVGVYGAAKGKPPAAPKGEPLTHQDHVAYQNNLLPAGEAGGLTLFKEPTTGGTIAIKTSEMNDPAAIERRIQAHRTGFEAGGEGQVEQARRRAPFGPDAELAVEDPLIREHRARQARLNEEWRLQYVQRMPPIVGMFRHWLSDPIDTLRESPYAQTRHVGELIDEAEVNKSIWFRGAIKNVGNAIEGFGADLFNRGRNINHVGEILDKFPVPNTAMGRTSTRTGRMFSSEEIVAATRLRVQLLQIWEQLHLASGRQPAPFKFGFIENYLPHLEKIPMPERVRDSLREVFGTEYEHPSTRYEAEPTTERRPRGLFSNVLRRRGAIAPDRLEYDVRKLMPGYLRGVSKVLFDRPALFEAEAQLKNLPPDNSWREYSDAYLDKYTGKRPRGREDVRAQRNVRKLVNATNRSLLGLSIRLQELHLGRLLTSVWPNMNTRDFAFGVAKVASNPKAAYERAAMVGILPQQVPMKFMSGMQRFDLFANYLGAADFIDRSVAFEGQYHRYLREGLAPDVAMKRAASDSKRFSFLSSPAHTPLLFGKGSGRGALDAVSQMSLQYKHIPTSIAYQYFQAMKNIGTDPVKSAKFTLALVSAAAIQYKTGVRLVHMGAPFLNNVLGNMAQPIERHIQSAFDHWKKGQDHKMHEQLMKAVEATMLLFPVASQVQRARRYGPKALFLEPSDEEKKRKDREWQRRYR